MRALLRFPPLISMVLPVIAIVCCRPDAVLAEGEIKQPANRIFFQQKVLPLLESRCYSCHGPRGVREEAEPAGGLLLTSRKAI